MILHRCWAVLVCQEAHIIDPAVRDMCATIVGARREEDDQMQEVLKRYE